MFDFMRVGSMKRDVDDQPQMSQRSACTTQQRRREGHAISRSTIASIIHIENYMLLKLKYTQVYNTKS